MEANKSCYLVNSYKNTTLSFTYDKSRGILYSTFQDDEWSVSATAVSKCKDHFIVVPLSDERLGLIYQDYAGNILIKIFNGNSWYGFCLIEKDKHTETYNDFKAVAIEERLYLFLNLLDKKSNTSSLCYYDMDCNFDFTAPKIIAASTDNHPIFFTVLPSQDNTEAYILYEQPEGVFSLGYKALTLNTNQLTGFISIDTSSKPFIDFSFLATKDKLHVVYIKEYEEKTILIYSCGHKDSFTYTALSEEKGITSCSIFNIKSLISCSWIEGKTIFNSLLSSQEEPLASTACFEGASLKNVVNCSYINGNTKAPSQFNLNEFFIKGDMSASYPAFINEVLLSKNNNLVDYFVFHIENLLYELIKNNELIFRLEQEKLKDMVNLLERAEVEAGNKDKEIEKLKSLIKDKDALILHYTNILNSISNSFNKFQEYKQLLTEGIHELQASILEKDKKIETLEKKIAALSTLADKLPPEADNLNTDLS